MRKRKYQFLSTGPRSPDATFVCDDTRHATVSLAKTDQLLKVGRSGEWRFVAIQGGTIKKGLIQILQKLISFLGLIESIVACLPPAHQLSPVLQREESEFSNEPGVLEQDPRSSTEGLGLPERCRESGLPQCFREGGLRRNLDLDQKWQGQSLMLGSGYASSSNGLSLLFFLSLLPSSSFFL